VLLLDLMSGSTWHWYGLFIMVRPFAGDQVMAGRWTTVFHELGDRHSIGEAHAITVEAEDTISQINCVLTGEQLIAQVRD